MPHKDKEKAKEYYRQYYFKNKEKNNCVHKKRKSRCVDCGGSEICIHKKLRYMCVDCEGSQICIHKKYRSRCVDCEGGSLCIHKKSRSKCIDCEGSQICIHKKLRYSCVDCEGVSICIHKKRRYHCVECEGAGICIHKKRRNECVDCSLFQALAHIQRQNIKRIMNLTETQKQKPSIEYLGCSIEYFKNFIQSKMTEEMTFSNIQYDHIKPISKFNLSNIDELLECCHYTNFQPLLEKDNFRKSNKWSEKDELFWQENIKGKEYLKIYIPN